VVIDAVIELFEKWNILKQKSNFDKKIIGIKERDILYLK